MENVLGSVSNLDLCKLLLKDYPPALELVGYGSCLSTFERNFVTGQAVYGPIWDEETTGFRTVEDFGCEDWEWLLRNHDWNSLRTCRVDVLRGCADRRGWTVDSLEPYDSFRECWRHINC